MDDKTMLELAARPPKARPLRLTDGQFLDCSPADATHVQLHMPGPIPTRRLPVILRGSRDEVFAWTWNGDTDRPTLRPSILSEYPPHICHTWVNDGKVQFLSDCSHELAGQTLDLLDVEMPAAAEIGKGMGVG